VGSFRAGRDRQRSKRDQDLYNRYHRLSESQDPNEHDIGCLGLGIYHLLKDRDYDSALRWFERVRNSELARLDYLKGQAQQGLKQYEDAEESFRAEIESAGYVEGAVRSLARLLYRQKNFSQLDRLRKDPEIAGYLPNRIVRAMNLRNFEIWDYLLALLAPIAANVNLVGFLGGVLIVLVWLYFLKRLDIFEPEKNRYLLVTFVMAAGATACLPGALYDILRFYLLFTIKGQWLNDLLYCIFGIGFIEELVKLAPFLIMLRFSRQVNESVDYIIYPSVSALGFSFMENLLYFGESSLFIIDERGMICSIGHMFYASLVGYGVFLARSRKIGSFWGNLVGFFLLACIFHGLYDFWIVSPGVPKELRIFSFLMILLEVVLFNKMIGSTLSRSDFYDQASLRKLDHLRERLGVALMAIVMFEYVALAWKYGPELTSAQFSRVIGLTIFVVFFLSFNLTHYIVRKTPPLTSAQGPDKADMGPEVPG
jgi:RsiW-degrading membrane proteinase PrsW (M82 family)